jgi:hypothetical protein
MQFLRPNASSRGTALPEYTIPLAIFATAGLLLGATGSFGTLGRAASSQFSAGANGSQIGSSISVPTLGSEVPSKPNSAVETNGSLGL